MQPCKTRKKWQCNILGVFCPTCLKFCKVLDLTQKISLDFKFRFYGNQSQNDCLLLKKEKVCCLTKGISQNNFKQYSLIMTAGYIIFLKKN